MKTSPRLFVPPSHPLPQSPVSPKPRWGRDALVASLAPRSLPAIAPQERRWVPFFILTLLALATTACTRTSATPPPTPPPPASATAAHYKAGHGIQLSPSARAFVGIATADFATRLPAAAVLRTVKGDFVYVANGPWFLRTPVTLGAVDSTSNPTSFALKEGLYEGDTIVTHGVRALWLAELQATNGGVGCADGH